MVPAARLMPIAPGGVSQIVAATKTVAQTIVDEAIANLPAPKSTPTPPAPTIIMQDHFYPFLSSTTSSSPDSQIGELGWRLFGSVDHSGMLGGVYPNVGSFFWSNNGTASDAGWLNLNTAGTSTSDYTANGLALFETPGWTMIYVFKLDGTFDSVLNFSKAQKSIYIGLVGVTTTSVFEGTPISRPDTFVGLRFDTSTTSPSINDSFFTFEVVANPTGTSAVRQNTQGTTQVTNIAPAIGVWHTLVITCPQAGQVTMTLDGGNTFTATIPTVTVTGNVSGLWANGIARLAWAPASTPPQPVNPWAAGTTLTVAGFVSPNLGYNGVFTLSAGADSDVWYDEPASASTISGTGITLSGFPAFIPSISFGNDDTASPTANNAYFFVDFWNYTI